MQQSPESLQDNTNAALPNIPEVTNSAFQASGSDRGYIQFFLNISINSN
ncbi:hypothetical protein, partial [Acinetobacter nosocomialis]